MVLDETTKNTIGRFSAAREAVRKQSNAVLSQWRF